MADTRRRDRLRDPHPLGCGFLVEPFEIGKPQGLEHDGPCLLGIDGLERHGNDLIAIQNGIQPPRVVRIVLTPDYS